MLEARAAIVVVIWLLLDEMAATASFPEVEVWLLVVRSAETLAGASVALVNGVSDAESDGMLIEGSSTSISLGTV